MVKTTFLNNKKLCQLLFTGLSALVNFACSQSNYEKVDGQDI